MHKMKIIITLDDKNGMMFNKRRQSRDSVLNQKVKELVGENQLFISPYSEKLFEGIEMEKISCDNFLEVATEDSCCFIEDAEVPVEKAKTLFVFRWNRVYPADKFFAFDLEANGFSLESSEEFVGSSHEKITLQTYVKGE